MACVELLLNVHDEAPEALESQACACPAGAVIAVQLAQSSTVLPDYPYYTDTGKLCDCSGLHNCHDPHNSQFRSSVSFEHAPTANVSSTLRLSFQYFDTVSQQWTAITWGQLVLDHERRVHVQALPSDLNSVLHVHPEANAAVIEPTATDLTVAVTLPSVGAWRLLVAYVVNAEHTDVCISESVLHMDTPIAAVMCDTFWFHVNAALPEVNSTLHTAAPWQPSRLVTAAALSIDSQGSHEAPVSLAAPVNNGGTHSPEWQVAISTAVAEHAANTLEHSIESMNGGVAMGEGQLQLGCNVIQLFVTHNGAPVHSLAPYLGAEAHLLLAQVIEPPPAWAAAQYLQRVYEQELMMHAHGAEPQRMQAKRDWFKAHQLGEAICSTVHVHYSAAGAQTPSAAFGPSVLADVSIKQEGRYVLIVWLAVRKSAGSLPQMLVVRFMMETPGITSNEATMEYNHSAGCNSSVATTGCNSSVATTGCNSSVATAGCNGSATVGCNSSLVTTGWNKNFSNGSFPSDSHSTVSRTPGPTPAPAPAPAPAPNIMWDVNFVLMLYGIETEDFDVTAQRGFKIVVRGPIMAQILN